MKTNEPVIKHVADWGAEQPWVARIQIGLPGLIRDARVEQDSATLEHLLWSYQQIGDELTNAFIALRRIKKGGMLLLEERKEYSNLFGHLWSVYKDRFQTFMKEFGYDIGFVFNKNEDTFNTKLVNHCKEYGLPNDFAKQVTHDRIHWQLHLADIRNDYNEHRKLPNDTDVKFFSPNIAEIMFNNVWQAVEDMIASHIKAEYDSKSRIVTIYEIPDSQRDPDMPLRFKLGLTPEGMEGLSQTE